jgi:pantetheine-phosphate adenylyltransferase
MKKKIAVYAGTFDPITYGHVDIVERARELFDHVIITVASNSSKKPLFSTEERIKMIREVIRRKRYPNVSVESFDGLLVNFARKKKAAALIRGLRATSDFEYEFQMALMNRTQAEEIVTVFLMPHEKYTYLNSSLVREIARHGGDIRNFVPSHVLKELKNTFKKKSV